MSRLKIVIIDNYILELIFKWTLNQNHGHGGNFDHSCSPVDVQGFDCFLKLFVYLICFN